MCQHENKICSKCNSSFECKVGNINLCQCSIVKLSDEERNFIGSTYTDCICAACLLEIKNIFYNASKEKHIALAKSNR